MANALNAVVIVRFDEDGEISYHVCGDDTVRLYIVDERSPNDRVFEYLSRSLPGEIRNIIPEGSDIGSNQDARHAAIAHVVNSYQDGKPHLAIVPPPDGEA